MIPDRSRAEPAPPGQPLVAEHALVHPIASGGYGQVWLARNALGTFRAIKLVYRSSFDHDRPFEREFAGIQRYEPISRCHEGLVDLLQVGRNDPEGYFYYVMELADNANVESGVRTAERSDATLSSTPHSALHAPHSYVPKTLKQVVQARGRLSYQECVEVGLSLSSALAYLHGQGLVHRDIKPSNVIFVEGVPKLADVGLVTGAGEACSYVGTEGFIAPEGPGTPQADIYSLGIVLYVMSTGKSHQDFPEPPSDLAHQTDHAQWLEFNEVIHKACRAQVRERYQTAQQMHEELALLQRGKSVKRRRAVQRRWSLARKGALGIMLIALINLVVLLLKGTQHEHTPSGEAKRLYELGKWHYNQLTLEDHKKALIYLTQATQVDPKYVQPYEQLIALYVWGISGLPGVSTEQEKLRNLTEMADKLAAINPNLAERHTALSEYKFIQRDWRGAEEEIVRSIQLNPNSPVSRELYAFYLSMLARPEEAHRQMARARELDPADRTIAFVSAWPFMAERRFDLAIAQLQHVLELDKHFPNIHNFLGQCYEAQSNYLAAMDEYKIADLQDGKDPARVDASYAVLRQAYEGSGQTGYFKKYIELIHGQESLPENEIFFSAQELPGCYARLGDKQRALDELEKRYVWHHLKFEPLYDSLHNEPRFKALLKRAGFE